MSAGPSRALPRRRAPLVALIAADGVSRAGNAITAVAIPLIALQTTGSALATGAAGVASTLPLIVGGVLGGALADRLGFRRTSVVADATSGAAVLAIPVLEAAGALPFWALLGLVAIAGLLDAPGTAARASQLPELTALAGTSLARTASARATVARTAVLVGAGSAGALVALAGPTAALVVNAACFAVSIALTLVFVPSIRPQDIDADIDGGVADGAWRELTAGLRFVWRTPLVRAIVVMVVATNAIDVAGTTVLLPLYAAGLGGNGAALGVLVACFAGGALVGAAAFGLVGDRLPRRAAYVLLFLVAGVVPYLVLATAPPLPLAAVTLTVAGLAAGPLNPLIDTALLGLIPGAIRARVLGALATGTTAAMPLGSALAAVGVDALGLTTTFLVASAAYATAILTTSFGRRWHGF